MGLGSGVISQWWRSLSILNCRRVSRMCSPSYHYKSGGFGFNHSDKYWLIKQPTISNMRENTHIQNHTRICGNPKTLWGELTRPAGMVFHPGHGTSVNQDDGCQRQFSHPVKYLWRTSHQFKPLMGCHHWNMVLIRPWFPNGTKSKRPTRCLPLALSLATGTRELGVFTSVECQVSRNTETRAAICWEHKNSWDI